MPLATMVSISLACLSPAISDRYFQHRRRGHRRSLSSSSPSQPPTIATFSIDVAATDDRYLRHRPRWLSQLPYMSVQRFLSSSPSLQRSVTTHRDPTLLPPIAATLRSAIAPYCPYPSINVMSLTKQEHPLNKPTLLTFYLT